MRSKHDAAAARAFPGAGAPGAIRVRVYLEAVCVLTFKLENEVELASTWLAV